MQHYRGSTVFRTAGALVAVVLIAALASAGAVMAQNSTSTLKAVKDPQNRFTIEVPASWNVTTQTKNPAVEAKSSAPSGKLPDSLDVTVYDWKIPINAHDCISESDLVLRYAIHTWTTVSEGPVTIGGQPGYQRVYTWKASNGEPRASVETCVTHGNRVYVAVGTTDNTSEKVSTMIPLLEHATGTLKPNLANAPAPVEQPVRGKN